MSIRRVIPPGLTALLLFVPAAARAQVNLDLAAETASLFIYEPFTLRLEVESAAPPETPDLPLVPGLAVTTVRRLPSDPSRPKHSFQIGLIAERDGILTVPPFPVRAGGETAMTPALRLRVRAPRPATEMELAIAVEPTALRVGQPATLTVTWTSAVPFARCKQLLFEIPLLADERCRLFPLDPPVPEEERIALPVNNIRLFAQTAARSDGRPSLAFRLKLIPREPCVLSTPPARLVCALVEREPPSGKSPGYFYNHFFEAAGDHEACEQVFLAAPVPEVAVRAPAETGRDARFAGIVGPCDLRTSVAPARLVVGQPALFTVHLDNLAFARHITGLPSAAFDGLRPEFQLSAAPVRETATDHARSFTRILRPLRPGISRIPAVVIQILDPGSGEFQTLRSAPIPVQVEADPQDSSLAFMPRPDSKPPIPLQGIRHNRSDGLARLSLTGILEFFGRSWWVFAPLPPLLWLALLPLARRWERCRRDPVYARAVAAWWRFRRAAWRDEELAWRNYLADRLSLCAGALTADTVAEALRDRRVAPDLVAETRRHFEQKDAADYGKRPAAPARSTRDLVRRLQQATVPLLLVVSLAVPVRGEAAESADEMFGRALLLRGERPDEAQPLFVEAALRFESAERFLNAGNGWFFAGETGRALANFRAAERRSPFDRQLRESIEFIRANRATAFPPPAAPAGRLAAFWSRFCTWAPVLRVGLFVLAYLAAWTVFLAAQLLGWRVRPALGVALALPVLMPLGSLAHSSFRPAEGVVIENTVARLGPGYAYDPAFQEPLHQAAEFAWLETRQGWVRARLPGGAEGWLRESDCMKVE